MFGYGWWSRRGEPRGVFRAECFRYRVVLRTSKSATRDGCIKIRSHRAVRLWVTLEVRRTAMAGKWAPDSETIMTFECRLWLRMAGADGGSRAVPGRGLSDVAWGLLGCGVPARPAAAHRHGRIHLPRPHPRERPYALRNDPCIIRIRPVSTLARRLRCPRAPHGHLDRPTTGIVSRPSRDRDRVGQQASLVLFRRPAYARAHVTVLCPAPASTTPALRLTVTRAISSAVPELLRGPFRRLVATV